MASLDTVSIGILLGALLVLIGILSSLVALRFGAPLLLVFLVLGMLAGEGGPGGIKFDDVHATYLVGSIALALILFDGGLRTRFATFRSVLAPSVVLATVGVLLTAALTAPVAKYVLDLELDRGAAGRRRRRLDRCGGGVPADPLPRAAACVRASNATLEVESGSNDPFAVFLTIVLVRVPGRRRVLAALSLTELAQQAILGAIIGVLGGRAIVFVLNRLGLPQGLHAPFVTTGALVVFGLAAAVHASGFLAVYLAGLVVGNRPTRAHNAVIVFLDAATWLAQIVMFVLLGLLAWPDRLAQHALARPRGRVRADAVRAPGRGVPVPRAVPVFLAGESVHRLGRPARRGRHLPRVDPAAGRLAAGAAVLRRRLRGGAGLAAGAGLEHRLRGAAVAHRAAAAGSHAAPRRARSARPDGAGDRRLSGARQ